MELCALSLLIFFSLIGPINNIYGGRQKFHYTGFVNKSGNTSKFYGELQGFRNVLIVGAVISFVLGS